MDFLRSVNVVSTNILATCIPRLSHVILTARYRPIGGDLQPCGV